MTSAGAEAFRGNTHQIEAEIAALARLLRDEGVRSLLEIGSKFGGSLWRLANALPAGGRVVSVDLNRNGPSLDRCVLALRAAGYDAHLIAGDSTDPATIARAAGFGPYDAVFIDANHKHEFVAADWRNYGPMARLVAFHDVGWRRPSPASPKPIDVAAFWRSIRDAYRHAEFLFDPAEAGFGIGVLWRDAA